MYVRCGMVYMDPNELGWRPYVKSWMQRTCTKIKDETKVFKYCSYFRFCHLMHLSILSNVYWGKYNCFSGNTRKWQLFVFEISGNLES